MIELCPIGIYRGLMSLILFFIFQSYADANLSELTKEDRQACSASSMTELQFTACGEQKLEEARRKMELENAQAAESGSPDERDERQRAARASDRCEIDYVLKHCEAAFKAAQIELSKAKTDNRKINYCRGACLLRSSWNQEKINGCSATEVEKILVRPLAKKYELCSTPAGSSADDAGGTYKAGPFAVDQKKAMEDYKALWQQTEAQNPAVAVKSMQFGSSDTMGASQTCLSNRISDDVGVCKTDVGVLGYKVSTFNYTDVNGNVFLTKEEAEASSRLAAGALATATGSVSGGLGDASGLRSGQTGAIAEGNNIPVPTPNPIRQAAVTNNSGGGSVGSSDSNTNSTGGAVAGSNSDSGSQINNASQTNSDPLVSQSFGGGGGGGGGSSFGDPSMFPSLQSAKVSARGGDEITSSSRVSSGKSFGDTGGRSAYGGGGTSRGYNANGVEKSSSSSISGISASEVSSKTSRDSLGLSGRGGIGAASSNSGAGGSAVQVASIGGVADQELPRIRIGDQGFYKPGGQTPGGATKNSLDSAGGKSRKKKHLKSVGGCAPGNLQCVLASIGAPSKIRKIKRGGSRNIASDSGRLRLPAGVTGGVEDIFTRIVRFHNYKIHLDHEGMIENGEGGFD
jgi:hypothetical protein